eukprot:TRINITY_DN7853_c0_g1::TRINITY_DN7853_c0_g1_i1::g.23729::m.23729 TRINITY_DN7853_c0_g1::TRINITY_DN7853_c0_g1_i1::g.23729  ORF type:complete len:626 (-),score=61.12 TRINITY_DN7853_c0_g1_i1:3-1880(-)
MATQACILPAGSLPPLKKTPFMKLLFALFVLISFFTNADAAASIPTLSVTSTVTSEDAKVTLKITPGTTDTNDVLRRVYLTNVPTGVSFAGLSSTTSARATTKYSLTGSGSGFKKSGRLTNFSLSPSVQSDVDFTMTVKLIVYESTASSSTSTTVGIGVIAAVDTPPVAGIATEAGLEDTKFPISITPKANTLDTDSSQLLRKLSIRHAVVTTVRLTFIGIPTITSTRANAVYTITASGTGFQGGMVLPGASLSPTVQCDKDFTLTLRVFEVEQNAKYSATATVSAGYIISAQSETPTLSTGPVSGSEDLAIALGLTPTYALDTDGSNRLRKVAIPSLASGLRLSGPASSTSTVISGAYTVTSSAGFTSAAMAGVSVSPSAQCDIDFTLSVLLVAVEENGKSSSLSTSGSVGTSVAAVADAPTISTATPKLWTEDSTFGLTVTPGSSIDTDSSEFLSKLSIKGSVRQYHSMSGTSSTYLSSSFTITASGTGFKPAASVAGLSASPTVQCDINFTMTLRAISTELNAASQSAISGTIGVSLTAVIDTPALSIAQPTAWTEDMKIAMLATPSRGIDTDQSERLRKLTITNFAGQKLSGITATTSTMVSMSTPSLVPRPSLLLPRSLD